MVLIVHKNSDQTASLAVTGFMEYVNLAAYRDGEEINVTCEMTLMS